jgi:hypothetical protein
MLSRKAAQTFYLPPGSVRRKNAVPISVFVSRKSRTLFVRQGYAPLFDVPIKIENPNEPLGTHVKQQSEGALFRWNVVSMPEKFSSTSASLNKKPSALVQTTGETIRLESLPDGARGRGAIVKSKSAR